MKELNNLNEKEKFLLEFFLSVYDLKTNNNLYKVYKYLIMNFKKEKIAVILNYEIRAIFRKQKEILNIKNYVIKVMKYFEGKSYFTINI